MVHMEVLKAREHIISFRIVFYQKNQKVSVGKEMEKLQPLCITGWEYLK